MSAERRCLRKGVKFCHKRGAATTRLASCTGRKRRPSRFAHVPGTRSQFLLHPAVHGNRRQHTSTAILGGVDEGRPVGGETRTLILSALCQHLHAFGCEIDHS